MDFLFPGIYFKKLEPEQDILNLKSKFGQFFDKHYTYKTSSYFEVISLMLVDDSKDQVIKNLFFRNQTFEVKNILDLVCLDKNSSKFQSDRFNISILRKKAIELCQRENEIASMTHSIISSNSIKFFFKDFSIQLNSYMGGCSLTEYVEGPNKEISISDFQFIAYQKIADEFLLNYDLDLISDPI